MIGRAEIPKRWSSAGMGAPLLVGLLGAIVLTAILAQGLSTQATVVLTFGALIAIVLVCLLYTSDAAHHARTV